MSPFQDCELPVSMSTKEPRSPNRILIILIGAIAFGGLMTAREEFSGRWARAGIAALAGGVLGWMVTLVRKRDT